MNKWLVTAAVFVSLSITRCTASEKLKGNTMNLPQRVISGVVKTATSLLSSKAVRMLSIPVVAALLGFSLKQNEQPYDSDPFNAKNEIRPSRH